MVKEFSITFTNTNNEETSLYYELFDTHSAFLWFESLKKANKESRLWDDKRFYNFPQINTKTELLEKLKITVEKLNKAYPNLNIPQLNENSLQESINAIHISFVDDEIKNPSLSKSQLWIDLNYLLHALEHAERSEKAIIRTGIPEACVIFTWENSFKQPIPDEDYVRFTIRKDFGHCYINYCHIGRHLLELFHAQDELAKNEHILPLSSLSADSYLWFGPSTGKNGEIKKMELIEKWFKERENAFNQQGIYWDNPRKALGWLPVAKLKDCPNSKEEQLSLINILSRFNQVKCINVN